jgi:hypothetical protein
VGHFIEAGAAGLAGEEVILVDDQDSHVTA